MNIYVFNKQICKITSVVILKTVFHHTIDENIFLSPFSVFAIINK